MNTCYIVAGVGRHILVGVWCMVYRGSDNDDGICRREERRGEERRGEERNKEGKWRWEKK